MTAENIIRQIFKKRAIQATKQKQSKTTDKEKK